MVFIHGDHCEGTSCTHKAHEVTSSSTKDIGGKRKRKRDDGEHSKEGAKKTKENATESSSKTRGPPGFKIKDHLCIKTLLTPEEKSDLSTEMDNQILERNKKLNMDWESDTAEMLSLYLKSMALPNLKRDCTNEKVYCPFKEILAREKSRSSLALEELKSQSQSDSSEVENLRQIIKSKEKEIEGLTTQVEKERDLKDDCEKRLNETSKGKVAIEEKLRLSTASLEELRVCFSNSKSSMEGYVRKMGNLEKELKREKQDHKAALDELDIKRVTENFLKERVNSLELQVQSLTPPPRNEIVLAMDDCLNRATNALNMTK